MKASKKALDEAIDHVKRHNLKLPNIAGTLFVSGDDIIFSFENYMCHAFMQDSFPKGKGAIVDLFQNPGGRDNKFFEWITCKTSPWRSALKNYELIYRDDGIIAGGILKNTKVDLQVYPDFQIACRHVWEHNRGKCWNVLTEAGIDPALSFIMTHMVGYDRRGFYVSHSNHHVSIPENINQMSLERFILGRPHLSPYCEGKTIYTHNGYRSTSEIWCDFEVPVFKDYYDAQAWYDNLTDRDVPLTKDTWTAIREGITSKGPRRFSYSGDGYTEGKAPDQTNNLEFLKKINDRVMEAICQSQP